MKSVLVFFTCRPDPIWGVSKSDPKKGIGKSIITVYLLTALIIIIASAILGFFAPYLISAKSTELVLFGVALCIILPVFAGWLIYHLFRKGKKLYEKVV